MKFKCPCCKHLRLFNTFRSLQIEIKDHIKNECPVCDFKGIGTNSVRQHIARYAMSGDHPHMILYGLTPSGNMPNHSDLKKKCRVIAFESVVYGESMPRLVSPIEVSI